VTKRAPSQRQIDASRLGALRLFRHEQLLRCEEDYRGGNKRALATAMQICFEGDRPIPDWVRNAWAQAHGAMTDSAAASWDDFLGGNARTPKRLANNARKAAIQKLMVAWLDRYQDEIERIDNDFFARMAEALSVGVHQAKDVYFNVMPTGARLVAKRRFPTTRKKT
jgi:hypothetical protein